MFWKKKRIENALSGRIVDMGVDLDLLRSQVTRLEASIDNFKDYIKVKVRGKPKAQDEELDLEGIKEAFGGVVPIEYLEKYKNQGQL